MPRTSRIAAANYPHHIVQRGHSRHAVFNCRSDFRAYLRTLAEFRQALGLKVHGYCLMTNHVHLIVDPGEDARALSVLMKRLAGRHTRRLNRVNGGSGSAWEGRFKCSPIESDSYLLACARYVDLNPVRAGMVARPEDYPWSSYRARIGLEECDWLDADPCFTALGADLERRRERYREFVELGIGPHELAAIRGAIQRNQLTGSEKFPDDIEGLIGRHVPSRARGRPPKKAAQ
ncbi:MAG TPA: transposase [Steroidobacteraceae bacterium]|nr:transposase [Steroidobacteraceae bacterium]